MRALPPLIAHGVVTIEAGVYGKALPKMEEKRACRCSSVAFDAFSPSDRAT
jgi:hypothetical protein